MYKIDIEDVAKELGTIAETADGVKNLRHALQGITDDLGSSYPQELHEALINIDYKVEKNIESINSIMDSLNRIIDLYEEYEENIEDFILKHEISTDYYSMGVFKTKGMTTNIDRDVMDELTEMII
jgi:hypothetical protein